MIAMLGWDVNHPSAGSLAATNRRTMCGVGFVSDAMFVSGDCLDRNA